MFVYVLIKNNESLSQDLMCGIVLSHFVLHYIKSHASRGRYSGMLLLLHKTGYEQPQVARIYVGSQDAFVMRLVLPS